MLVVQRFLASSFQSRGRAGDQEDVGWACGCPYPYRLERRASRSFNHEIYMDCIVRKLDAAGGILFKNARAKQRLNVRMDRLDVVGSRRQSSRCSLLYPPRCNIRSEFLTTLKAAALSTEVSTGRQGYGGGCLSVCLGRRRLVAPGLICIGQSLKQIATVSQLLTD